MSAAYLRSHHQRLVSQKLCICCEAPTFLHVRCTSCHQAHLAQERLRNPARGIYACTLCRQRGHNAATCEQAQRAA